MSLLSIDDQGSGEECEITDDEKSVRFNELIRRHSITKDFIDDSVSISVRSLGMGPTDWHLLSEELIAQTEPLQSLDLSLQHDNLKDSKMIEPGFTKFVKYIEEQTTLQDVSIHLKNIESSIRCSPVLEAFKNNHSIKHLTAESISFDIETSRAFAQIFMNNQTLLSLNLSFYADTYSDYSSSHVITHPITNQCILELAPSLQTTTIQRLHFAEIDAKGLEILVPYLPTTLIYLDLSKNKFKKDITTILYSYFKSNGKTLKQLILDDNIEISNLQEKALLAPSVVKITHHSSFDAKLFRHEPLQLSMHEIDDNKWSKIVMEVVKYDGAFNSMNLNFNLGFDRENFEYLETLLGKQSQLKQLAITNLMDTSLQTEVFQLMKDNTSIIKLRFDFEMDSKSFNELIDLLKKKTNLIELELIKCSNFNDDHANKLADVLKSCTQLQHLIMEGENQIGDNGFQAVLSSLPTSLIRLIFRGSSITEKSLSPLLTFIQNHSHLKELSIEDNGINNINSTETNISELTEKITEVTRKNHCICNLDMNGKVKQRVSESMDDEVNLYGTKLHDHDIFELCNELKKNPDRNWSLDLGGNNRISPIGYGYLAELLSSKIPIVQLSVASNYMNDESKAILLRALSHKKTLRKCVLNSNKINHENMEYMQHFIEDNPALQELELASCGIDYNGITHLAKVLRGSCLEKLELRDNSLGDLEFGTILDAIPPTLTDLSVRGNEITESSLQTILTFLRKNRTLKKLDLCYNPIYRESGIDKHKNKCYQQLHETAKLYGSCDVI